MDIIQSLDSIDKQWLLALNNDYPAFWDGLMVGISEKITWVPLYIALLYVIIRNWRKESWWLILGLILCVTISDQISSGLIKELVHRFRPTHDPQIENLVCIVNGYRGGSYGFVSSHAANSFGVALLSSLFFRNKLYTWFIFVWAVIVSYSRIYLGVHYPGDILGGALVGIGAALFVYWILKKLRPVLFSENSFSGIHTKLPIWILLATFVALGVYSAVLF